MSKPRFKYHWGGGCPAEITEGTMYHAVYRGMGLPKGVVLRASRPQMQDPTVWLHVPEDADNDIIAYRVIRREV